MRTIMWIGKYPHMLRSLFAFFLLPIAGVLTAQENVPDSLVLFRAAMQQEASSTSRP